MLRLGCQGNHTMDKMPVQYNFKQKKNILGNKNQKLYQ